MGCLEKSRNLLEQSHARGVKCYARLATFARLIPTRSQMTARAEHPRLTFGRGLLEPALALALLFSLTMLATPSAKAQTYNVIHSFSGLQDGLYPVSGVTVDASGNRSEERRVGKEG